MLCDLVFSYSIYVDSNRLSALSYELSLFAVSEHSKKKEYEMNVNMLVDDD